MKKRVLAAIMAAVMTLGLTACGGSNNSSSDGSTKATADSSGEKVVTMAITKTWGSFNPFGNSGNFSHIVSDQLYDRLWVNNKDGSVEPRLAESYEVLEDHSGMIVHLDKRAKFSDGEPVTADDVVFSARLDASPDFNSLLRDNFTLIAGTDEGGTYISEEEYGFKKVDDYTVEIDFKQAMNELPILTLVNRYLFIVPEHIYGKYSMKELNEAKVWEENMVGSGPFIYESSIDDERVEMTANKDYFLGAPDMDKLVIRVVESSQMLSGLVTGEIDIAAGAAIGNIPLTDWSAAEKEESLQTVSEPEFSYQCMMINMSSDKVPNAECRHALNEAINRQVIVDNLLEGQGTVLYAPFSDEHPYVDLSKLKNLPKYDPEAAKKALKDNGFDFDQTLELIVTSGSRLQTSVLIQQNLADIGVKVNITEYDFATLMDKMRAGEYDLGLIGSAGGIEPSEPAAFHNNAGAVNFSCIPDDRFMKLFNKAKTTLDPEEQKEAYTEAWQKVIDESAVCYLYSENSLVAYNKNKLSDVDTSRFSQINWKTWEWKVQ